MARRSNAWLEREYSLKAERYALSQKYSLVNKSPEDDTIGTRIKEITKELMEMGAEKLIKEDGRRWTSRPCRK